MSEIEKETEKRKSFIAKWGGLIFIISVIVVFIILAISGINFGQWLAAMAMWFYNTFGDFGIYLGVFVISIFGNFTIIFPVPYLIAIIVLSIIVPGVNPIILGIIAGFGASIGEVSAWLIGRGSVEFVGESESTKRFKKYIDKGWAPLLIFLFAATPLPDDALLVVIGFVGYSITKTIIWCFLGKFCLCALVSAAPTIIMDLSPTIGNLVLGLFGINLSSINEANWQESFIASSPEEIWQSTFTWIVTILLMFSLIYIDWSKLFSMDKEKTKETKETEDT